MAGSKSTQTRFVRDNCIYYTSLRLLFFIITYLLMSTYFNIEWSTCKWKTFRVFLVVTMVGWSVWFNHMHYYRLFFASLNLKASVGMYSRCDYPLQILFVYFLILPSLLHPSILFNCFYTCSCSFFIAILSMPSYMACSQLLSSVTIKYV